MGENIKNEPLVVTFEAYAFNGRTYVFICPSQYDVIKNDDDSLILQSRVVGFKD